MALMTRLKNNSVVFKWQFQ